MNSTSAALVIIHALWPGPGTPTVTGFAPSLERSAAGSLFVKYASMATIRSWSVGVGAGAGACCARNGLANDAMAAEAIAAKRVTFRGDLLIMCLILLFILNVRLYIQGPLFTADCRAFT